PEQRSTAGHAAGQRAVGAAGGGVGNRRDRHVEALGLGLPGRLLDRQAETGRNDRVGRLDPDDRGDRTRVGVAIRDKQRRKGGILGVVRGAQKFPVRRQRHFVNPRLVFLGRGYGRDCLFEGRRVWAAAIDHFDRAVTVTATEL